MERWALDLHDSTIDFVKWSKGSCEIHFKNLWLQKAGTKEESRTTGWTQPALLIIKGAHFSDVESKKNFNAVIFPSMLESGNFELNGVNSGNTYVLPLNFTGTLRVTFSFLKECVEGSIAGNEISLHLEGSPEFREYKREGTSIFDE